MIGSVGGDSKYGAGALAYFRTRENAYGFAREPFNFSCHSGRPHVS
jgi:hypothetical protein